MVVDRGGVLMSQLYKLFLAGSINIVSKGLLSNGGKILAMQRKTPGHSFCLALVKLHPLLAFSY